MIKDFEIENFRGIQSLKFEGFSNVNIFVGKPNTGKTSILEALYLYLSKDPRNLFSLSRSRGTDSEEILDGFFYNYDLKSNISLKGENNEIKISPSQASQKITMDEENFKTKSFDFNADEYTLQINQKQHDAFEIKSKEPPQNQSELIKVATFISHVPNLRYRNLIHNLTDMYLIREKRMQIAEICKNFSKDIETIHVINMRITVELKNLPRNIDLALMGNGFQSYLSIFTTILFEPKYILIDEIENGLHFENISLLMEKILDASNGIQFFITTHNEELLRHVYYLLKSKKYGNNTVSVFTTYKDKMHNIKVSKYQQESFVFHMAHENELRS